MSESRYTTSTTVVETTEYVPSDGAPTYRQVTVANVDCSYIRTLGGIMKCVCIALCLLCFLCVLIGGPGYYSGAGWATFVSSVGLCISSTLLFLYLFRVVDALPQVPWIVGEMCYCFVWTIFFFIASCVLAVAAARFTATGGWAVAAFFGFGAMCAYGFDCYLKFLSWKNDEVRSRKSREN
uniref:MARVEL domain-containing protein n=1 Tax=Angiostrongylus cantonensis TaxID=6313 RepID=A0A0K0D0K4_ANGCA